MTHQDWVALFAPAVATLVLAVAGLIAAVLTGLTKRARTWLDAKGDASAATAVAAASSVIQAGLLTGASTIAGKIARGEMDYTDRTALAAEAMREAGLAKDRLPQVVANVAPPMADMVASLMGKVDQQLVASPTPLAAQVMAAPVAVPTA